MRIDFHCHTKAVKKGEKDTRNITAIDFKEAVKNANVKMVAITNHNVFEKEKFDEFKKEVNNEFILLPGIELDVIGLNDERGHVVIVYDDNDIDNFTSKINDLLKDSTPNTFTINIKELISFLNKLNCIILAHYYKPDSLDIESINELRNKITDNFRFFYEPSNYRTLGIMINHNFRTMKGTDIIDWSEYGKQDFASIKLEIDSYKQLLNFLKKDATIIESLLNTQTKYEIDIAYKKGEIENVEFYDNVNIFFGTKGTGKTVSLEKIEKYFKSKGKSTIMYSPNNTKDKLDEKLKVDESEKLLASYGKENLSNIFLKISNWVDSDVTQFSDYINYSKYKDQNANKKRMKIVEINSVLGTNAKILTDIKNDYKNIQNILNTIKSIDISKYLDSFKNTTLVELLNDLNNSITTEYCNAYDESMAIKMTNNTVRRIKSIVEKKTETKTIPDETGIISFIKNRLSLEVNIQKIIDGFDFKKETEPEFIGVLEEGKTLSKKTIISMLNNDSKAEDGFTAITIIKNVKNGLEEIHKNVFKENIAEYITNFNDLYLPERKLSLDSFLGVTKKFVLEGKEYKPSSGEATMIVLDESLNEDNDVFILDEPEKSLGNNYVSDVLVRKINDLAKMKKVVIVATHNANIAVRTLPYRSVLKVYDNGEYKTYIGNPYVNKLINIHNEEDFKSWKDESIRILEGGKEAFEERSDIYA